MLTANKKKRKQKTRGAILQDATVKAENYGGYFKGQNIYNRFVQVWRTAFTRGYEKALKDLDPNKPEPLPKAKDIL
jgi:DNA-binding SARP family transcriptional activator